MKKRRRTGMIIVIVLVSFLLYMSGVMSGLYANRIIKKETQQDIDFLKGYVDILESNLESMQLEQVFIETLDREERCAFSAIAMGELMQELGIFWDRLPFRIEEFERGRELTPDYMELKQQYTQLSIRAWITAKNIYDQCSPEFVPVLYFYSSDCERCVAQGRELDRLKVLEQGVVVFTIDFNEDERILGIFKQYYNLTGAPAVIMPYKTYQGRLFEAEELAR
ncbi:MAG: hypothetical protein KJ709_08845 [Nanoarchaeota archaeon]|nr:hypothetical protein [Nanoarchaeota archaeon]